jgi:hypothetical protein
MYGCYVLPSNTIGTMPSGVHEYGLERAEAKKVKVVEYWDRQKMCIVIEQGSFRTAGERELVVEEWEHGFGRVPYFCCPAFENELADYDADLEGPLDGIYAEVEGLNELVTMRRNVTHLRSYPSWQQETQPDSAPVLDNQGRPVIAMKYEPGKVYFNAPGARITNIPMDASPDLLQEVVATDSRIAKYSLDPIARGVSPGADTANSAISQLRRQQRSNLERMSRNRALQYQDLYRFRLAQLREFGEAVPVFDEKAGDYLELSGDDVPTLFVTVKYAPDTGTDMLIEEKQAFELFQGTGITELEFHERRGKENPEEYVIANMAEQARKLLLPELMQQVVAALNPESMIAKMLQAKEQTGSARGAAPGIIDEATARQGGGMGSGSPDMPRAEGVRSPALQGTTQPGPGSLNGV